MSTNDTYLTDSDKESSSGSEVDTDTETDRRIAARDMGESVGHPDRRTAAAREGRAEQRGQSEDEDSEEERTFHSIIVVASSHRQKCNFKSLKPPNNQHGSSAL